MDPTMFHHRYLHRKSMDLPACSQNAIKYAILAPNQAPEAPLTAPNQALEAQMTRNQALEAQMAPNQALGVQI